MRTKNFKNFMAMIFERCGTAKGLLPVKDTNGTTYYVGPSSPGAQFPYSVTTTLQTSVSSAGFCVGSGSTEPTEDDYNLANQITSGLSASIVTNVYLDDDGNPAVDYDLMITNTGSAPVTIAEIGYKQTLYTTNANGGTSFGGHTCLLDRTVLSEPVTIEAGAYAVIRYTMKTTIS